MGYVARRWMRKTLMSWRPCSAFVMGDRASDRLPSGAYSARWTPPAGQTPPCWRRLKSYAVKERQVPQSTAKSKTPGDRHCFEQSFASIRPYLYHLTAASTSVVYAANNDWFVLPSCWRPVDAQTSYARNAARTGVGSEWATTMSMSGIKSLFTRGTWTYSAAGASVTSSSI